MQYRKTEHDPFFLATVTVTMAKRAFRKQNSAHAVNQLAIIFTIEKRRKQSLLELIRETLIRIWKWFHQLPLPIPTEAANVDSHALMLPQHHRPALRPPHPTTTIRRMKTWTIAPAVMDSMPPRGGERIIKIAQGVGCFKKKIIGRYPPSFPGQRRCRSRVVNPPVLLVSLFVDCLHMRPCFVIFVSVISFSRCFISLSFSKQTNSHHLPSAQFRIIHTPTTSSQSHPSKDSGATTSCSAASCRNRPPQIRERIPPDAQPKGRT